jgi:hypothetical protein
MSRIFSRTVALLLFCAVLCSAARANAQGVTSGQMTGVVKDPQGQVVPGATVTALHVPSGSNYEAVTQSDGRFFIPGMRVGGPYKVTAALPGFSSEVKDEVTVSLGTATDLNFTLKLANVSETITVVGQSDPVFSSSHTGAATAVLREELASLPTISGRINDMTRLTPQYSGSGGFGGADNRMNNITVDGSYFNNSFGLGSQPGDRTNVAPISLEAIEQVQVNIAPFDVRQGNFVGAGVNTVTRSGTNNFTGSGYYRYRNDSYVGKEAAGQTVNPGTFKTTNGGEWLGGPIVRNRLFFFESFESQKDNRPLTTFVANPGGAPASGNTTRVLASDLDALSAFLSSKFTYDTGPYQGISKLTPAKPFLVKGDYNANSSNKITFRYNLLNSRTPVNLSSSSSLGNGTGRQTFSTNFLNFANSNYAILENIRSGIGEWNSVLHGTATNNLIIGYTHQDESRDALATLFPFVDILSGGNAYTSFGSEPFTPNNELRYNTFQAQDSLTKFAKNHSLTLGGALEKYHSENVFFPGKQSAYVYNSKEDFYADANDFLANPNRTVSPVAHRFQVRYMNIPSLEKPIQPLDVWYTSAYAQDEWRPKSNLTVTAGVRMDVATWGKTAYDNPNVDALAFRDQNGSSIQYNTGALPNATPLWSPRVGINYDLTSDQKTQLRGGTGVFTGKPLYVWISNQIGNTGMLTGFTDTGSVFGTAFPFNPNPDFYKPKTVTGAPATSVDLAVTDPNFKFPQTWRSNIAVDRRLGWGLVGTGEFIYNRDVNGMLYINANLPAAQGAFTGVDARPRWVATTAFPACVTSGGPFGTGGQAGPCVTRLNNAVGNQIVQNIVLTNESVGHQWNVAASIAKQMTRGFTFRSGYTYGEAKNVNDPGSIAAGSWNSNAIVNDSNNPALSFSQFSPGHRYFLSASYSHQYFNMGATTVSAFYDAHTNGNSSYIFGSDANGDTAANDLIYIPRNTSEMNFVTFSAGGKTFTSADQAAAFEAYIQQDDYLSKHRGEYAQRYALFYPIVKRTDLSLTQDVFHSLAGHRHAGQIRLDINNFGNLLNHNWGAGQIPIQTRILTTPTADANGALSYRLATVTGTTGTELISHTFQTTAGISDVYVMMLSFRYTFQ